MSSPYSFGEEVANAVTHGIGALLSIAALVIMVAFAVLDGDAWLITSVSYLWRHPDSALHLIHAVPRDRGAGGKTDSAKG